MNKKKKNERKYREKWIKRKKMKESEKYSHFVEIKEMWNEKK